MTIRIDDANAWDKLVEMEGDRWASEQRNQEARGDAFWEYCAPWYQAVQHWTELAEARAALVAAGDWTEEDAREDARRMFCIVYGLGGWHRFIVRRDGVIEFSAHHAPNEETVERARALGFDIN